MEGLIITLVIGGLAGWLAGLIVKGGGQGILINIVVGIVGAFIGNWLFGALDVTIGSGFVPALVSATVGAVVLLLIVGLIRKS